MQPFEKRDPQQQEPYLYQPPMGRPPMIQPPYPPYPSQDSAALEEKKRVRRTANLFGAACIVYFVVNLAVGFVVGAVFGVVQQFTGLNLLEENLSFYLVQIVVYVLSFTVAFGAYLLFLRMPWRVASPWRPVAASVVGLSIPATFAVGVAGSFVTSILSMLVSFTGFRPVTSDIPIPHTPLEYVLYFFILAVLPPLFEEFSFRGVLMQSLRRFGDWFALLVSSIVFGLFHLNMVQAPYAFFLGLWMGYLVLRTGSLRISVILHVCINLSAGIFTILMEQMSEDMIAVVNLAYMAFWMTTGVVGLLLLYLRKKGPLGLHPANTKLGNGKKTGLFFSAPTMIVALGVILFFTLSNFERI